jgi:hypothetical protein
VEVLAKMNAKPDVTARAEVARLLVESEADGSLPVKSDTEASSSETADTKAVDLADRSYDVFLAVRQRNILATSFHPELTNDDRWHR